MEKITIDQLGTLFANLIDHLKRMEVQEISFDEDLYWVISSEEMTVFDKPPDLMVGSLKDDITFLKTLLDEKYETEFLELERLASVLRFLSKSYSP